MIRLEGVSTGYGPRIVLHDIDLHVEQGEMVAVLGPNGSGKTTLLLAITGILPFNKGTIRIQGEEVSRLGPKERAKRMASVPQRLEAPFDIRVLSLVLMGRYPHISFWGGYSRKDREIALEAMRSTRSEEFRNRSAAELSGGEFQRVAMARALAQQTDVLLLDEAASGLDIARKIEIYDLLRLRHKQGVTILSTIHDLNLAALYCDRLVFLKHGRIVLDGPTGQVFTASNLSSIYETTIHVSPHPVTGAPQGHPVPGGAAPDADGQSLGRSRRTR